MKERIIIIPIYKDYLVEEVRNLMAIHSISIPEGAIPSLKGNEGSTLFLYGKDVVVLFVGIGDKEHTNQVRYYMTSTIAKHKKRLSGNIDLDPGLIDVTDKLLLTQLASGIYLGLQEVGIYKTTEEENPSYQIGIGTDSPIAVKAFNMGLEKAKTISSIINLVNAPSNHKTTEDLASWLKHSSDVNGYSLRIIEKQELERLGFHALLAVNRGSEVPAKCLIATYGEKKEGIPSVTIVGKGVTFDTGGLSIKGSNNMHYMKSDMGGAAAAMGAIELVAKNKLNIYLRVIIPTTDNSVDAHSIKPGDVISSYSGKTIEVIDTDAEGRLILADGLSYAVKNDPPDFLLDLATLTGSIVRAIGTEAAGIMSHSDDLVRQLSEAGRQVGERLWRMPMWKEYGKYMESDIADVRNLGAKPMAGSITAAKFLEHFVEDHPAWAHMDIAGTAFGSYPTSKGYSATGYGIDLLFQWMQSIIKN